MRDKLAKEIKKRFGAAYGSKELKEIRAEMIKNALDRYDEEIANGANETDAFNTARDSLGDIGALLDSMGVLKKKRRRGLAITIPITAVLFLLSLIPFLISPSSATLAISIIILVPVALLGFGMISLACGFKLKGLSVTSLIIGGALSFIELSYFGFVGFFIGLTMIGVTQSEKYAFDYTKELDNIKSIEIVEITDPADCEDKFGYEAIGSVPSERYADALSRIAALEYTQPVGIPPKLRRGDVIFIIRFREPKDGLEFVIIGYKCPGYGETNKNGVKILTQPYWCDRTEFEAILNEFGGIR